MLPSLADKRKPSGVRAYIGRSESVLSQRQPASALDALRAIGQRKRNSIKPLRDFGFEKGAFKYGRPTGLTKDYAKRAIWTVQDCVRELIQNLLDGVVDIAKQLTNDARIYGVR
jgi:hypothetical protein